MKLANTLMIIGAVALSAGFGLWDVRAGLIVGGLVALVGGAILAME